MEAILDLGDFFNELDNGEKPRALKGKSLLSLIKDYVVVDIETTGLSLDWDEIIEISAVRITDCKKSEVYSTLVKPERKISQFITDLTGITDEMVADAPSISEALPKFLNFIGDSVLIGHNVNFDVNFLYENCERFLDKPLTNDFVDTMRIARRLIKDLQHYRLGDIAKHFNIDYENAHRAENDCNITHKCYEELKELALSKPELLTEDKTALKKHSSANVKAGDITTEKTEFDESNPLFDKVCVITGTLEKMERKRAMQLIADCGGKNADSVTKKTDYLILGNNDYKSSIKDGKSSKQKKAEDYILKGFDITILPEDMFYQIILESEE